jgi:pimeloyl-ACP methyl ester carboxylesterase
VEDSQAAHAGVEHANRPGIHTAIVSPGYAIHLVRRLLLLIVSLGIGLAAPGLAQAKEVSLTMGDGVRIDASLLVPDGAPPAGGWPAVMLFHGLGGNHASLVTALGPAYLAKGYAVFAPDARGHGTSQGFVSLDGPREVADIRTEFQWLAANPAVSDTQIGAWGISLGGGAAWNSVVAGVPFKALETFETWSDLYRALYPQNLGKSGAIYNFAQSVPADRIAPDLRPYVPQMIGNENLPGVRQLLGTRSSLSAMSAVTTPSFLFQGRRDFAFDIDQATDAYRRLAGPKRLYVGDFGHSPSSFPGPDLVHVLDLSTRWYDRFLKGIPNGVDKEQPVQVASDPWSGKTASFAGLPATTRLTLSSSGRSTLTAHAKIVRTLKLPKRAVEQFGAPVLRVTATTPTGWPHLVAVVTSVNAQGQETVLTEGGTITSFGAKPRTASFKLISAGNLLRRGSKLRIYLGATSTVQNVANLLYLKFVPDDSRLNVRKVTLTLPLLRKPISR